MHKNIGIRGFEPFCLCGSLKALQQVHGLCSNTRLPLFSAGTGEELMDLQGSDYLRLEATKPDWQLLHALLKSEIRFAAGRMVQVCPAPVFVFPVAC